MWAVGPGKHARIDSGVGSMPLCVPRSFLLEAWYAHTFEVDRENSLQVSGVIIDPAFYVMGSGLAKSHPESQQRLFLLRHPDDPPDRREAQTEKHTDL